MKRIKSAVSVALLSTTMGAQALYLDGCVKRAEMDILVEFSVNGHNVLQKRCTGAMWKKRVINRQLSVVLRRYRSYKNKNNYVRAYRQYLKTFGITIGYTKHLDGKW
jgi:hypothetical protein